MRTNRGPHPGIVRIGHTVRRPLLSWRSHQAWLSAPSMHRQNGSPGRVGIHTEVITGLDAELRRAGRQHPGFGRVRVVDQEVQVHLHGRGRVGQAGGW